MRTVRRIIIGLVACVSFYIAFYVFSIALFPNNIACKRIIAEDETAIVLGLEYIKKDKLFLSKLPELDIIDFYHNHRGCCIAKLLNKTGVLFNRVWDVSIVLPTICSYERYYRLQVTTCGGYVSYLGSTPTVELVYPTSNQRVDC